MRFTMAYDETLATRIRNLMVEIPNVEEKHMMGGIAFMVNDKMCVGVNKDDLMVRHDPDIQVQLLERTGCRQMDFTKRPMKGFVFVDPSGTSKDKDLKFWVDVALEFNPRAKASRKKGRRI